jgi:23S rRNA pseudouridine1911/1915/1917 synthase
MGEKPAWLLYEDRHIVVLDKPAGIATQAPAGIVSVTSLVRDYLRQRYGKWGHVYLGVPQRLDRPVSGVVVLARQTKAARRLHEQFQQRTVRKIYWALVSGDVVPRQGIWQNWLRKREGESRVELAQEGSAGAKWAQTSYRVLAAGANLTLVELQPKTGRMHQLRAQAAWRGHPIVGDVLYGSDQLFGCDSIDAAGRLLRIALHARQLTFRHPYQGEFGQICTFEAPLPTIWQEYLTSLASVNTSTEEELTLWLKAHN